jgi:hypothetical protein
LAPPASLASARRRLLTPAFPWQNSFFLSKMRCAALGILALLFLSFAGDFIGAASPVNLPLSAEFQFKDGTINMNARFSAFSGNTGVEQAGAAITLVKDLLMRFAAPIFILFLVIIGVRMVVAVDAEKAKGMRFRIATIIAATMAIGLAEVMSKAFKGLTTNNAVPWAADSLVSKTIVEQIAGIFDFVIFLLALAAVVVVIFNAALLFIAEGNPDEFKTHTRAIVYACLGLVIIALTHPLTKAVLGVGLGVTAPSGPNLSADFWKEAVGVTNFLLGFVGAAAMILAIWAGFRWMTAGDDEEAVASSRKILINALIGIAVVVSSYTIVNFLIPTLS